MNLNQLSQAQLAQDQLGQNQNALAQQGLGANQWSQNGVFGQVQNCQVPYDWNQFWVQPTVQWHTSPCYLTHLQNASTADIVAELKRRLAKAEEAATEAPKLRTLVAAIEASGIK